MTTLFISDLHLDPDQPESIDLFLNFLKQNSTNIDALYILGDFFNTWIGDDDRHRQIEKVKSALKTLSSKTPIFLMHGNRDFLIGKRFLKETGCQFLDDPCVIDLYGTPTLLMHGDLLCTKDIAYLKFRRFARYPLSGFIYGLLPLALRKAIANKARKISKNQVKKHEDVTIIDVTPEEIPRVMREHGVTQLIHGHTHQPAIHYLFDGDKTLCRMVLSDWHSGAHMLTCSKDGVMRLEPRHTAA